MCQPRNPVAPVTLTDRLVIQTISLVDDAAAGGDAGVDRLVVLEGPRQLAAAIPVRDTAPVDLGDEKRIQTEVPVLGEDAEQRQPGARDDGAASEEVPH